MKRNLLFALTSGILLLASCGESVECECIRASAEGLKKARETGYEKAPTSVMEDPSCKEFAKMMEGKTQAEQKKIVEEQKSCDAYADLQKEQKLWKKHMQEQMEEAMRGLE